MFIDINKVYGFVNKHKHYAGMVELVDTSGLSPVGLVRLGSSPSAGTSDQREFPTYFKTTLGFVREG